MSGESDDVHEAFSASLNAAIAHGLRPSRWTGLGEQTCSALEAIAREHPDATVDHIADAYDAFDREHGVADAGAIGDTRAAVEPPPNRLTVQRRFKRS